MTSTLARLSPGLRPLELRSSAELDEAFSRALATRDGPGGAHCIHETWMRGAIAANIESAIERLWKVAPETIPDWLPMRYIEWLPVAYEVAARFTAQTRGRFNLYLVLLDYRERGDQPFGVYVGMSRYSPAARFDQHKAGIRSARSVLKRGIEVLPGPTLHLQRLARSEAADIEVRLGEALTASGIFVKGGH